MIVNVELFCFYMEMLDNFSAMDCKFASEVGDHQGRIWRST